MKRKTAKKEFPFDGMDIGLRANVAENCASLFSFLLTFEGKGKSMPEGTLYALIVQDFNKAIPVLRKLFLEKAVEDPGLREAHDEHGKLFVEFVDYCMTEIAVQYCAQEKGAGHA